VILLQQRAPLFAGKRNQFIELLTDFVKKENFSQVICLVSSHAYERLDSQLVGYIYLTIWNLMFFSFSIHAWYNYLIKLKHAVSLFDNTNRDERKLGEKFKLEVARETYRSQSQSKLGSQ
jgi:hypothetical protein